MSKAAPEGACEESQIGANLQALRALQIVQTGDLLRETPGNNPNCYNLPCPEDVAKARETTCKRAGELANIVQDAEGL